MFDLEPVSVHQSQKMQNVEFLGCGLMLSVLMKTQNVGFGSMVNQNAYSEGIFF